jgi:hypothetical protein
MTNVEPQVGPSTPDNSNNYLWGEERREDRIPQATHQNKWFLCQTQGAFWGPTNTIIPTTPTPLSNKFLLVSYVVG